MNRKTIEDFKVGDHFLATRGIFSSTNKNDTEVHVFLVKFDDKYEFAIWINGEELGSGSMSYEQLLAFSK